MEAKFDNEVWVDIPNCKLFYLISNYGRVKRYMPTCREFRLLNGSVNKGGYLQYSIYYTSGKRLQYAHRLCLQHFKEVDSNRTFCNHKDGNKLNNYIDNLEWVTNSENIKHAAINGFMNVEKPNLKGSKNHQSKKIIDKATGIIYDSIMSAALAKQLKPNTLRGYLTGLRQNKSTLDYAN